LRFSECFPVIMGFSMDIHILLHHHFLTIFLNVGKWAPSVKYSHPGPNL